MGQQENQQKLTVESQLDAILQDYMEQIDRGVSVDQNAIIAANPELADLLNNFFAIEADINQMAGPLFSELELGIKTGNTDQATSRIGDVFTQTVIPKPGTESFSSGIPQQFGRYKIIKQLGAGAMGEVYLAEDTELHRKVALKIPLFDDPKNTELAERFYREARSSAILRHANICPVYDVGELEGVRYISMAYIEGAPLSDLLKSPEPVPERRVAYLIRKLALGLTDAHEQTIIHRDLKPANIMLDKKGEPVVMDFGLACITNHSESARITRSGQILGTPAYMPPEQIEADLSKIGPGCDIYSLGVIFYELLAGQLPFQGSVASVLGQIMTQAPKSPHEIRPEINAELEVICMKMMAKSIADRQTSMKEVARDLLRWLKENPAAGQRATLQQKTLEESKEVSESKEAEAEKSIQELTASSHGALLDMARKLLEKHDYEQVVQLADKIPEKRQTPELLELFDKAQKLSDELTYLTLSIQELRAKKDYHGLIPKLQEFLKLKPINRKVRKLLEDAKVKARYTAKQDDGNAPSSSMLRWITEDATTMIAVGLIAFGIAFAGITMYLRSGGRTIQVRIDDPTAVVTIDGKQISIKGKSGTTRLSVGDRKVTVTLADGTVAQGWDQFVYTVKKGKNVPLDIRVLPQKPPAKVAKESPPASTGTWKFTAAGKLEGNTGTVGTLQISPDGNQLHSTTFGSGGDISKFWDLTTGSYLTAPSSHHGVFLSNQQFLFAGVELQRYDLSNKKTIWKSRLESFCHSVTVTPNQKLAVTGGFHDPFLYIYHLQTGQRVQQIDLGNVVWSIAIHPNGKTAWIGSVDEILIVDLRTGKITDRLKGSKGLNNELHFTKDGKNLISPTHNEGRFWLWNVATRKVIREFKGDVRALSFLPGDQQIISGSGKSLRLWDVATGKQLAMISAETNRFKTLAVSPDGKYVYTGGGSQYIQSKKGHDFDGDYTIYKWRIVNVGEASAEFTPTATSPRTPLPTGPTGDIKKLIGRADGIKPGHVLSNLTPTEIITSTDWKWTEPVNLGKQINTIYKESGSCLSADGLTLYFHSDRPGGEGDIDLYQAVRKSLDQPFGKPTNLGPLINSSERDQGPAVSTDGLTILFHSKRSGNLGDFDIWQSNRSSIDQPFGKPVNMGTNINSSSSESHPSLSPDRKTLVFVSRRPGSLGNADFYMSTRNSPSEKFGNAVHLPHLSSNTGDYWARFTPDGRAILFGSFRPPNLGGEDFWISKRTNNGKFETPVYLESPLNSSAREGAAAFTPNGQTVIFDSMRPGGLGNYDLWMSHRVPKKISP